MSQNKDETRLQLDLWTELLGDLPYQDVVAAVKKLILDNPFPPAISDVQRKTIEIMRPQIDTTPKSYTDNIVPPAPAQIKKNQEFIRALLSSIGRPMRG